MKRRTIEVGLALVGMLAGTLGGWRAPALAGSVTCDSFSAPSCGDAAGDAACGDPNQDCIDTGNGCGCRPRVCCTCENVGSSTGCDVLGCTQTGIGLLACLGVCLANEIGGNTCNLKIVNGATCSGGSCPTTGCCQFDDSCDARSQDGAVSAADGGFAVCTETDQVTCALLGQLGTFVSGGSCSGGLTGTCVSPTPTSTPTATPTVTPTNTPLPIGDECSSPTQCQSTFCVDGVCCDSACNQPLQVCNAQGNPGICTQATAPAPALSPGGLLLGLAVLALVGVVALAWRVRPPLVR